MNHVDYHAGLLKGHLISVNAHQILHHALEVILTHRRNGGEIIGNSEPEDITTIRKVADNAVEQRNRRDAAGSITKEEDLAAEDAKVKNKFSDGESVFIKKWSEEEIRVLGDCHTQGMTTREIIDKNKLPGRKYQQIYAKQTSLGLAPHNKRHI